MLTKVAMIVTVYNAKKSKSLVNSDRTIIIDPKMLL